MPLVNFGSPCSSPSTQGPAAFSADSLPLRTIFRPAAEISQGETGRNKDIELQSALFQLRSEMSLVSQVTNLLSSTKDRTLGFFLPSDTY
jgi:hypothetical protein